MTRFMIVMILINKGNDEIDKVVFLYYFSHCGRVGELTFAIFFYQNDAFNDDVTDNQ